jgi:UDP-N-acetylmuramate dehydrogenase
MLTLDETRQHLSNIPSLSTKDDEPLALHTRFGLGGPAALFVETGDAEALAGALRVLNLLDVPYVVIGGGTNLVVSDQGYRGVVLRFSADSLRASGATVSADAGAVLQDLVEFTVGAGLAGLETLAGIPGSVGAAVYGNAGAYGHSISERVRTVRLFDGRGIRALRASECEFRYRESIFKRNKEWIVLSASFELTPSDAAELRRVSGEILSVRNRKFPETLKCAGSVFKNLLYDALPEPARVAVPPDAVREGKVPAAWFLEQVGAKGMTNGGIHVADYHANLLYNAGAGTSQEFAGLVAELKRRVQSKFGLTLEEEVQYVGFPPA